MIQTIRIGHVLRETVAAPYRVLVTRPTGAAVRGRIQEELIRSACETALLDFSEVDLLDFSCADEVVAKLLATEAAARRYLMLRLLCEDQREAIDHVLQQQRLAVAALLHSTPRPALLGWTTDDARAAFAAVCADSAAVGEATIAARLGWTVARARDALRALARHRVVRQLLVRHDPVRPAETHYAALPVPLPGSIPGL